MPEQIAYLRTKVNVLGAVNDLQRKIHKYFSQYSSGLISKKELEICVESYLKSTAVDINERVKAIKY